MIDFVQGRLVLKSATRAVIECGGVGYEVLVPVTTSAAMPPPDTVVRLLTVFHVRDDAHVLFGFATETDRQVFRTLTGVTGVGPKIALAALSYHSADELVAAISRRDVTAIKGIPGVGPKLANRIVLELSDNPLIRATAEGPAAADWGRGDLRCAAVCDAEAALVAIGDKPAVAGRAVANAVRANPAIQDDVDALIRAAINS